MSDFKYLDRVIITDVTVPEWNQEGIIGLIDGGDVHVVFADLTIKVLTKWQIKVVRK